MKSKDVSESQSEVYTREEFCYAHKISKSTFDRLIRNGNGPKIIKLERIVLITKEAAAEWRNKMES